MNRIHFKNLLRGLYAALLGTGLILTGSSCCNDKAEKNKTEDTANVVLANMTQRKSVRHFVSDKKVDEKTLETLVKAGMTAPTARNSQPWEFYIITSPDTFKTLEEGLPYAKMLSQVSAAIVVCGNVEYMLEGEGREYWVQDCSAATQNILLAAEALGLGAVWTGVYPVRERVRLVQEALSLPSTHLPLCLIPVGYPDGQDQPKDKYKADRIHWK